MLPIFLVVLKFCTDQRLANFRNINFTQCHQEQVILVSVPNTVSDGLAGRTPVDSLNTNLATHFIIKYLALIGFHPFIITIFHPLTTPAVLQKVFEIYFLAKALRR